MSVLGCGILDEVTKNENLYNALVPVPLLKTCLFGNGDLMMTTGATAKLKSIFEIGDQFDAVIKSDNELSVCPYLFFFKSTEIGEATTDGHEDVQRTFCGDGSTVTTCYKAAKTTVSDSGLVDSGDNFDLSTAITRLNTICANKVKFK